MEKKRLRRQGSITDFNATISNIQSLKQYEANAELR
jgi:hypothetical protein